MASTLFIFQDTSIYKSASLFCQIVFKSTQNCTVSNIQTHGIVLQSFTTNRTLPYASITSVSTLNSALLNGGYFNNSFERVSQYYILNQNDVDFQLSLGLGLTGLWFVLCVTFVVIIINILQWQPTQPQKKS